MIKKTKKLKLGQSVYVIGTYGDVSHQKIIAVINNIDGETCYRIGNTVFYGSNLYPDEASAHIIADVIRINYIKEKIKETKRIIKDRNESLLKLDKELHLYKEQLDKLN